MASSRTSAAGKASTSARGGLQEVAEGSDTTSGSGGRLFEIRRLSGPEASRIGGVNGDEMDSDLKSKMFLDLFDAFLGSQATALPQSAGAAEVSGYSFQSGQYVDDRAVQMSRRVTSATSLSLSGTRAEGEGIHVIAVAASDLLNNHLAFCAFGAPGSAEQEAGQDKSSQKWHIVPWKRGRFHSITALSFSSDGSHLLVGTARGAYALNTKAALEHLLESEANAPKREQRGDREGGETNATPSRGGQRGRRKSAANATWSWDKSNQNSPASIGHGAGQQTSPDSSPRLGGVSRGRTSSGREISALMENSHSKVVSCLCWKRSADGADVACVVTRSGLITMFDLDSKSQLCQTEIDLKFELGSQREVAIRKVFHAKACASQSLLLCSSPQGGGPFYSLLLECKDPNGSLNGYEALPEAAILKAFQVTEMEEGRFGTSARNGSPRSGAQLAVHQGSHATLVSCHDTVANIMEVYDADRPEDPVFVHRVPPLTLHLVVTQALILAIHGPHRPLDESEGGGEGAANGASGSVAGLFNSSSWYGIAGLEEASDLPSHYFVSIISRFIGDPERGRGPQAMNLVLEQLVVPNPFGKASTPLGAQRMGEGVVLWTDASAFVCAAARDPEDLFFSLLQGEPRSPSPEPTRKADLLALALRLDILRLYKQAAARALRKKKFEKAKAYFDLAGLSDLDVACELLAAQCPERALAIIGGGSKGEGETLSPGREAVAEGKTRVLRHAAIAMKLMQTLVGADENVASDAASAASAAIADWALVCCRRGDEGKRKRGEKSFRLMVSAAILASILHAPGGLPSESESAGNESIRTTDSESIDGLARIHESDFREMFFSMMKTGAVSNLPFATEEDLVTLLTRDVTETEAAAEAEASSGSFTLGFHERTVSALFAMQARLRGGDEAKEGAERQRLQADLERICSTPGGATSATHLDTPWALPACVAWNNSKAAARVLETLGIRESALMCRILELSSSASAADWSSAGDDGDDDEERRGLVLDLVRLCEKVEEGPKRVKCLYFLLLFWIKAGLPMGALERGILANGLRKGFCGSLLEAEKLCAAQAEGGIVFSGSFLWQVAQKTCTDEMERKVAAKTWAKIKRAMFPGNQGKGGKRHASRKIVVGVANLRKAGRGQLVVFSCGHHFTDREFRDRVLPGLHAALEDLARPLGLTKTLLMAAYRGDTFPLSCPVCTYNAIAAKFAKPAISPKYWLG